MAVRMFEVYKLAVKLLRGLSKQQPEKSFTNSDGETLTIADVANYLNGVSSWMFKDLAAEDIEKVVRCKRCVNYKRFKKKGDIKSPAFYACKLDMKKRDPMFYCKDGEVD